MGFNLNFGAPNAKASYYYRHYTADPMANPSLLIKSSPTDYAYGSGFATNHPQ